MTQTEPKTTIYTISKQLGVAPSTVSKALNHSPEISAELRERVQNLAETQGFRPRLVSNRVPNICALIQQVSRHPLDFTHYLAHVLEGIAQYIREENLELSIYAADVNELNSVDIVRELKKRSVSGAVILRATEESQFYPQLERQRFPYISLLANDGRHLNNYLGANEEYSIKLIMDHLWGLGHRHLAILDHAPQSSSSRQRIAAAINFCKNAEIETAPLVLTPNEGQNGLVFGRDEIKIIRKKHPEVTAVIALSHSVAIGAIRGAADDKIPIPLDLSIASVDAYPESEFLVPSLTTVSVPNDLLGYQAARLVHRQMRDLDITDMHRDRRLMPLLTVRESTGMVRI